MGQKRYSRADSNSTNFVLRKNLTFRAIFVAPEATVENIIVADVIVRIHYFNVILVLTAALVAAVWGLILFFTKRAMNRPWRIALIVTGILAALQGVLGISLVALGLKPGTGTDLYYLHYVYGGIVALSLPVALTYTSSGKNPRRDILIFSIAALILAAAGVRAWITGPLPK